MKKWFVLAFCFVTSIVSARMSHQEHQDLLNVFGSKKSDKLNSKVVRFYITHPKTAEYLYAGSDALKTVLNEYCTESNKLIERYPQARASTLAERRVANLCYFLNNQEILTKAGIFLFLGVYDLEAYQDTRTYKQLLNLQEAILTHAVTRAKLKADIKTYETLIETGVSPLETVEYDLMKQIKDFCQKSKDPFFQNTLSDLIKNCETREDILKYFSPLRDETAISEIGEVVSNAEEDFSELNTRMWLKLRNKVEQYFNRPAVLERFIEITSDTFDIPHLP